MCTVEVFLSYGRTVLVVVLFKVLLGLGFIIAKMRRFCTVLRTNIFAYSRLNSKKPGSTRRLQISGTDKTGPQVSVPEPSLYDIFDALSWDTCDFNNEGTLVGFRGKYWNNYPVVKLRILRVYGVKNAKKDHAVDSIMRTHQNSAAYAAICLGMEINNNNQQGTRKEQQCPYRLMNTLFSDAFTDEFACIGNTAATTSVIKRRQSCKRT
jgi:hypothetical protein